MALTGAGTSASPYLLSTREDFIEFHTYTNGGAGANGDVKYFKMMEDIDMEGYVWTSNRAECLSLYGNNKTVSNLVIKGYGMWSVLHGSSYIYNINFKNLHLILTSTQGGAIFCQSTAVVSNISANTSPTFMNIQISGKITSEVDIADTSYVSGIVGNIGANSVITNCNLYLKVDVKGNPRISGLTYVTTSNASNPTVRYNVFNGLIKEEQTLLGLLGNASLTVSDSRRTANYYNPELIPSSRVTVRTTGQGTPLTLPITQNTPTNLSLATTTWGVTTDTNMLYLKSFGEPNYLEYPNNNGNIFNISVGSYLEYIDANSTLKLVEFLKQVINVLSEIKEVHSDGYKTLSKAIESHTEALNSNSDKMLGLNLSSHLDPLESVTERQTKSTKNSQSYMGNIQAYMISNEIKRLLIELKMEVGSISSEIKSTTKIKNKVVTNSLNDISTNINTIARVKNMISNNYVGNIDTSSIEERIKFINSQALLSPFEANVFKGKYARVENFAQALSTHIAEQNKKKTSYPTSTITEVSGSSYAIKKLLKSVLSDLDIITAETLTETRFFLEKWVKVQSQMKQHKTKLDYANWGV